MRGYRKGADFERELVRMFWEGGWAAVRAAGSGTTKYPVPDVFASKDGKIILVECKSTKKDRLSLGEAMRNLETFRKISGGNAYIAIKFDRQKPRFYALDGSRKNSTISDKDIYLDFQTLTGKQKSLL